MPYSAGGLSCDEPSNSRPSRLGHLESGRLYRTGDQLNKRDSTRGEDSRPHTHIRLLAAAGACGAVVLAASLAVNLSGANDVTFPSIQTPSGLPTSFPSVPGASDLPTEFPSFSMPTDLPTNLPTDMPSLPDLSGLTGGGS